MARYDPNTDEITGDHTLFLKYHEERHREQYRRGWGKIVDEYHLIITYLLIAYALAIPFLNKYYDLWVLMSIGFATYLTDTIGFLWLEIDANIVGFIQARKHTKVENT